MRSAFPFHEVRQYAFFFGRFGIRVFLLGAEDDAPPRFEYLLARHFEVHLAYFAENRGCRDFAIRIEGGNETAGDQVVDLPFVLRQVAGVHAGRDDRMVVRHLRIVEHALVLPYFRFQQRGGQFGVVDQAAQRVRYLRINVVTQVSRVYTRIGRHFLFIERLDQFQRVVCRKGELLVTFHLQRGQVEKTGRIFLPLLFGYVGDGEIFLPGNLQEGFPFLLFGEFAFGGGESRIAVNRLQFPIGFRLEVVYLGLAVDDQR